MHRFVGLCVCLYILSVLSVWLSVCLSVCLSDVHIYTCLYVYDINKYIHTIIFVYIYIYIYIYMYVYVCIYIYIELAIGFVACKPTCLLICMFSLKFTTSCRDR